MSAAQGMAVVLLGCILASCSAAPEALPAPTSTMEPGTTPLVIAQSFIGMPAYERDDWRLWVDADGDCQKTRTEVLIEESQIPVTFDTVSACRVVSGQWAGLYTGTLVVASSELDIDHMVPLLNAHISGGWSWSPAKKQAYANDLTDPDHLIAVTASANRSKGARGPDEWKPPDQSYWCEYATDWIRIKQTWNLTATAAEWTALQDMLDGCDQVPEETLAISTSEPMRTALRPVRPGPGLRGFSDMASGSGLLRSSWWAYERSSSARRGQ